MRDHEHSEGNGKPTGSTPSSSTVENLREKVRLADDVLCELEHPKNMELRGRTTKERLARIENFLKTDPIYLQREERYRILDLKPDLQEIYASWYREEVRSRLKIFERLANRNPEMKVDDRLLGDYRWVYRQIAREVYYQVPIDEPPPGDSIFQLEPFATPKRELNTHEQLIDDRADGRNAPSLQQEPEANESDSLRGIESGAGTEERSEQDRQPTKLSALDERLTDFRSGGCGSYGEAAKLYSAVIEAESVGGKTDLTDEERECLSRCEKLVGSCEQFAASLEESARSLHIKEELGLCELINSFRQKPCPGLGEYDPLEWLVEEEALTKEGAQRLKQAAELLTDAHPATKTFLENLSKTSHVSLEDIKIFDECAIVLSQKYEKEQVFINHVKERASDGLEFIDHLKNLVTLLDADIDVRDYLNIKPEQQRVVGKVVTEYESDKFKESDGVISRRKLQETLTKRINSSRTVSPLVARTVESLMKTEFTDIPPQQQRDIHELLLAVGDVISHDGQFEKRLKQVCEDALTILNKAVNLSHVKDVMHSPTREITHLQMIEWLHNLSELSVSGIIGIEHHVAAAHTVWLAEQRGDTRQDLTGFPTEANCILKLHQDDVFPIHLMSHKPIGSGFEFDGIGYTDDQGRGYAFEVKKSLSTLLFKFEKDEIPQPYRFVRAAIKEGLEPVFVIESYLPRKDHKVLGKICLEYERMERELGARPRIYNATTGQFVEIEP